MEQFFKYISTLSLMMVDSIWLGGDLRASICHCNRQSPPSLLSYVQGNWEKHSKNNEKKYLNIATEIVAKEFKSWKKNDIRHDKISLNKTQLYCTVFRLFYVTKIKRCNEMENVLRPANKKCGENLVLN